MKYRFTKFVLGAINNNLSRKGLNTCFVFTNGKDINYWANIKRIDEWASEVSSVIDKISMGRYKK